MAKAGVEMFGRDSRAELAGTCATAVVLYPGWGDTAIACSAMGGHDTNAQLARLVFPGPLRRHITPETVAKATLCGLEKRAPRIMMPVRWLPISLLRGVFNPLSDWLLDRHRPIRQLIRRLEGPG
jgi:NAD(P)-dependent dehydrogenase (short-subunit alcohol dehydrogenase family)